MRVIVCFGDSNTYGRDPVTLGRLPRDARWPGVLQERLGAGYLVIEEGLNGRTTVWDDPVRGGGHKRNGSVYLPPCLESHAPIDLLVLMLGTNDCKARFAVTPFDIGQSMGHLIEIAQASKSGPGGAAPRILLMAPPPLGRLEAYGESFQGAAEKSKHLARCYREIARQYSCEFLDAGEVIAASRIDGLHFDPEDHRKLGQAVAERIGRIFSA